MWGAVCVCGEATGLQAQRVSTPVGLHSRPGGPLGGGMCFGSVGQ